MKSVPERIGLIATLSLSLLLAATWTSARAESTSAITGTIHNTGGSPLGGALVHFLSKSPVVRTTVITNGTGRFSVELPPGSFEVSAGTRGYAEAKLGNPMETNLLIQF